MSGRFSASNAADALSAGAPLSVEEERALLHVLNVASDLSPVSLEPVGVTRATSLPARTTGVSGAVKPKKKRSHTTSTRDREAKELRALRFEAVELSARLEELRAAIIGRGGSGNITKRQRMWRHVARRQLALRRQAESETARLVRDLHFHRDFVRTMQSRWMELSDLDGSREDAVATASDTGGVQVERNILEERERNVLDRLASQLDDAYALVGVVLPSDKLSACDVSRLLPSAVDANSWLTADQDSGHEEHHEPVELRDDCIIPFGLEQVVDAAWKSWVQWHVGGASSSIGVSSAHCAHSRVDRPEDTFAVKFRIKCSPCSSAHGDEYLDETLVVRRYVESDRLVLVWRGTSEGDRVGVHGMLTDETGWIVVERSRCEQRERCCLLGGDSSENGADCPQCRCDGHSTMRSYVRMVPRTRSRSSAHDRPFSSNELPIASSDDAATTLAHLVAELYRQDVNFIRREMETLLIREARRSSIQRH